MVSKSYNRKLKCTYCPGAAKQKTLLCSCSEIQNTIGEEKTAFYSRQYEKISLQIYIDIYTYNRHFQ